MGIRYQGDISPLPSFAHNALMGILAVSGVRDLVITSTKRTPREQASVMYSNIEKLGVESQRRLYKMPGQQIVDAYVACKKQNQPREIIIDFMEAKIKQIGAEKVSNHCTSDNKKSVFDVAPSSIQDLHIQDFSRAIQECKIITKCLKPPIDPCYHIEMEDV